MRIYSLLLIVAVVISVSSSHNKVSRSLLPRAVSTFMVRHSSRPSPTTTAATEDICTVSNCSSSNSSMTSAISCSHTIPIPSAAAIIICGPSGVGKGTLIKELLRLYPEVLGLSVSHTSRPARSGETNGSHYHFVSRETIETYLRENSSYFIETAEVHGNLYGTSIDAVRCIQAEGKICVLDVDTKGVLHFKRQGFPAKYIFLVSPTKKVLEKRLRGRGTENEQNVHTRLANAEDQMSFGLTSDHFDAVVVNDDLDTTVYKIKRLMNSWFTTKFSQ